MEVKSEAQEKLFQKIRTLLTPHISLVDEVSEALNISTDSAYRRIRGEKRLLMEEFLLLSRQFRISADELLQLNTGLVCFNYYRLCEDNYDFEKYLESIHSDLENLSRQENPHIYLIFNELNIFQILLMPVVAAFKFFFWGKSNLSFPGFQDKVFSVDHVTSRMRKLSRDIINLYINIPTVELIASEALSSMLKQLVFYYEAGFFASSDDVRMLCDELLALLNHVKKQAEFGFKFDFGTDPVGDEGNYKLYFNDLVMADNTVVVTSGQTQVCYITANVVNLLVSDNPAFYRQNLQWAKNLTGKSTLISGTAERDRNKYFNIMQDQITATMDKIVG